MDGKMTIRSVLVCNSDAEEDVVEDILIEYRV